jgi:hypothetical protein
VLVTMQHLVDSLNRLGRKKEAKALLDEPVSRLSRDRKTPRRRGFAYVGALL